MSFAGQWKAFWTSYVEDITEFWEFLYQRKLKYK